MVEPSSPVNDHIRILGQDEVSSVDTAACCQLTEIEKSFKSWVVKVLVDLENRVHFGVFSGFGVVFQAAVLLNSLTGQGVDPCF